MLNNLVFQKRPNNFMYNYYVRTKDKSQMCTAVAIMLIAQKYNIPVNTVKYVCRSFSNYYAKHSNSFVVNFAHAAANHPANEPFFTYKHSAQHNAYYVKAYKKHNATQAQYVQAACVKWGFTQAQIKSVTQHVNCFVERGYKILLH